MTNAAKWIGLLGACVALGTGPGCMLFDDDYDDYDDRPYQHDTRHPAAPPVEQGQAGVYQEKR